MTSNLRKTLLVVVLVALSVSVSILLRPTPDPPRAPGNTASPRLSELLSDDDLSGYAEAQEPREFSFPADHGPHPEYRNEWWYVTGNLDSITGRRFGYELTIFRFALTPAVAEPDANQSAWRSNQVYIAHLALTDGGARRFHVAQRFARGSLGLAGATMQPLRIWLGDWAIAAVRSGERVPEEHQFGLPWRLQANDEDVALSLTLVPQKRPVLNGVDGLSRKSAESGNASYYYSLTRLRTEGAIRIGAQEFAVRGLSWMDREWGSSALADEQQGWDWFALQLSDGSDLMFYNLRRNDGSKDVHSAGTLTLADGSVEQLTHEELHIEVLDTWESPLGGRYPIAWRLTAPRFDLNLDVDPVLDAQELDTTVRYWEGAVDISGTKGTTPLTGRGYVELTGYANAETQAEQSDVDASTAKALPSDIRSDQSLAW